MKENVVIDFVDVEKKRETELEIPISISANELIIALNDIYDLNMNIDNIFECYLVSERPFAFLKGNKKLSDFGIRNGSKIIYKGN